VKWNLRKLAAASRAVAQQATENAKIAADKAGNLRRVPLRPQPPAKSRPGSLPYRYYPNHQPNCGQVHYRTVTTPPPAKSRPGSPHSKKRTPFPSRIQENFTPPEHLSIAPRPKSARSGRVSLAPSRRHYNLPGRLVSISNGWGRQRPAQPRQDSARDEEALGTVEIKSAANPDNTHSPP